MKVLSRYLMLCLMIISLSATSVLATNSDLDSLTGDTVESETTVVESPIISNESETTGYNKGLTSYIKGYEPITEENMAAAQTIASPIVNVIGNITGFLVIIAIAAIGLVTGFDLLYIGVPFLRPYLDPAYGMGAQAGGAPMGGGMPMMGGYGHRGMMGGMMGGMQAQQQQPMGKCFVSDEAKACLAMVNPAPAGGGMPMGGMPMGGMPMGGMPMGGMPMGGQQQPQMSTKSVIFTYLKKRTFFIVIFVVASIFLTSSILLDCGINMAELLFKVVAKFNSVMNGVDF